MCVGEPAHFSILSPASDSGGSKLVECEDEPPRSESIPAAAPTYTWVVAGPDTFTGSGQTASFVPAIAGDYSCAFTARARRDCEPEPLPFVAGGTIKAVEIESLTANGITSTADTANDAEEVAVCLGNPGDTITITANSNPGSFPSGQPIWSTGESGVASIEFPIDAAGEFTISATCDTSVRYIKIFVIKVEHETVATIPADRTRTTIGVCEEVSITINLATSVTWSLTGGGTLSSTSGTSTVFTAGDSPTTSKVTATLSNGEKCEVEYTVIAPSGVSMTKVANSKKHVNGTASCGFLANITITPTTVSFGNIEGQEQAVAPVVTGFYSTFTQNHAQGGWFSVGQDNIVGGQDQIFSGNKAPPFSVGTYVWAIPWHYRCAGTSGAGTEFKVVNHSVSATATGKVTMSKAGASESCNASDPTTLPF